MLPNDNVLSGSGHKIDRARPQLSLKVTQKCQCRSVRPTAFAYLAMMAI